MMDFRRDGRCWSCCEIAPVGGAAVGISSTGGTEPRHNHIIGTGGSTSLRTPDAKALIIPGRAQTLAAGPFDHRAAFPRSRPDGKDDPGTKKTSPANPGRPACILTTSRHGRPLAERGRLER